ncbi:MAG TPA: hypothetical protein G4N95_05880, partial [Anaerolineae bacterium]|nr:hypothetical protein [Anaerolineae bacterium]
VIFELDGTLLKTERLKAISYAKAIVDLCPSDITQENVLEAFNNVVGLSRQEVIDHYALEEQAMKIMKEFQVKKPWQAFSQLRIEYGSW